MTGCWAMGGKEREKMRRSGWRWRRTEQQVHLDAVTPPATENSIPTSQAREQPPERGERPEAPPAATVAVPHITARDHLHRSDCQEEVFGGTKRHNYDAWEDADADPEDSDDPLRSGKRKPYMVSPIQLLSTGLQDFFKRPGMVSAVNSWRTRTEVDGELRCMQDARVWKELKDGDGDSFFFSPKAEEEEIRLGVRSGSSPLRRDAECGKRTWWRRT
ncbi:hypothetical protein B0H10DRAFT_1949525 [Mycena sp. CBHHK59/15]|nr:hypothetical protein B0H10DRAFT_1949525 [Mycena sp. CBHHK59/15]